MSTLLSGKAAPWISHLVVLVDGADIVETTLGPPVLKGRAGPREGWRGTIPAVPVNVNELAGEGASCHYGHLNSMLGSGTPEVCHQLELPEHNAGGKEEEEAGKKDGEENKEVNMKLVLPEKNVAVGGSHVLILGAV